MSPSAIFLYEIDESFGPNMLAEYYLSDLKVTQEILKQFIKKHVDKELVDALIKKDNDRYYSSKIHAEAIKKSNLYLGFILRSDEDLISLKSIFEKVEKEIVQKFSDDKKKMKDLLKDNITSIMSLMEKLKEPKIIINTINEKTKKMLDDGKLQEARELIDLGQTIPDKLAAEITLADQLVKSKEYKKAKKTFEKAAELAAIIQESEIVSFLKKKGEQVGMFPELIRERDLLIKEVKKEINNINVAQLNIFEEIIPSVERLILISHSLEEEHMAEIFTELKNFTLKSSESAKKIINMDKKMKESTSKF